MCTPLSPTQMLSTMIEREVTWLGKYIDSFRGRKFAIFAAGLYAKKFYKWLLNEYGIEAAFFIDNNPDLVGQT